jgi:TolB-like protein
MERRLAAILAADVVGYTALMGADEDGTLRRLTELRQEILEPLISEHHGRIFKLMGDGLLVEFVSVVDTVACALAWQEQIARHESSRDVDTRLQFRIGINLGDVIVQGSDIHGDSVNIASRLEGLAEPGGVCLSDDAYRQAKGKTEAVFEDMGEQDLKNVAEPVRVYRIAGNSSDGDAASSAKRPLPLPDKPSIAVLAFDNMSSDAEQAFFSDGITEDIITELSRFSELFVIARNSSFAYKGQSIDVKQVARELGVRYILEGSVRRAGNRVRITAQLIDRETGGHIWAEKYDRDLEDIFELQEEVTCNVVASIAPQIELAELERSRRLGGANLSAYELSLKAQVLLDDALEVGDPKVVDQAIAAAGSALELDNRNSRALWTQGAAYIYQHLYRWGDDPDGALVLAGDRADRLIQTDASNPKAHTLRAWVHQFRRDHDAAIAEYRRALDLNPNFAMNLFTMAWGESVAGLTSEAKEHAHRGLRLSPRDTDQWLGEAYLALTQATFAEGDFEETLKWGRLAIQMGSKAPIRRAMMIASYGHLGNLEPAGQHAKALKEFAPDFIPALLTGEMEAYKMPEHNALLLEGLRKAGFQL